ncbi:MAG: FAD binding domain-containing protein [Treponema sp.]|jgi:CO/xanthine dehydrogenase FAD-binding subunit|nr:FAD binding domain-containing protein [Treponema sp.]
MDAPHSQVFLPTIFPELFAAWSRFPDAVPFAGGTELISNQDSRLLILPRNILFLNQMDELRRITRTERYLEVGAMVKLNEIIQLGKIVPKALSVTLQGIAGPFLRSVATIGGNLCSVRRHMDAAAAMTALDARYELRSAAQIRWISASRFSSLPGSPALNPQELLTRIRIPLEQWDYSFCRKIHPSRPGDSGEGAAVFIAQIQKNILTEIRVVFAGRIILRDKNSETFLAGKQLPLDRREAKQFTDLWKTYLSAVETPSVILRAKLLNFIETGILGLTD